jgi:hypothetical protein
MTQVDIDRDYMRFAKNTQDIIDFFNDAEMVNFVFDELDALNLRNQFLFISGRGLKGQGYSKIDKEGSIFVVERRENKPSCLWFLSVFITENSEGKRCSVTNKSIVQYIDKVRIVSSKGLKKSHVYIEFSTRKNYALEAFFDYNSYKMLQEHLGHELRHLFG